MHDTAMQNGNRFFKTYISDRTGLRIVDLGSQDVNGSLRELAPEGNEYIGIDFVDGKGVDLITEDPYSLPLKTESVDVIVSSSCFEHSEFFWLLFTELMRVLKPQGLLYVNAPSNGAYHRYPVDCWRFYPDSGVALQNWARREGYATTLLESYICDQAQRGWNDFVAVFVKDSSYASSYTARMKNEFSTWSNGRDVESDEIQRRIRYSEDQRRRKIAEDSRKRR